MHSYKPGFFTQYYVWAVHTHWYMELYFIRSHVYIIAHFMMDESSSILQSINIWVFPGLGDCKMCQDILYLFPLMGGIYFPTLWVWVPLVLWTTGCDSFKPRSKHLCSSYSLPLGCSYPENVPRQPTGGWETPGRKARVIPDIPACSSLPPNSKTTDAYTGLNENHWTQNPSEAHIANL